MKTLTIKQKKNKLGYLQRKLKKLKNEKDDAYQRFIGSSHRNSGVWVSRMGKMHDEIGVVKNQIKQLE